MAFIVPKLIARVADTTSQNIALQMAHQAIVSEPLLMRCSSGTATVL